MANSSSRVIIEVESPHDPAILGWWLKAGVPVHVGGSLERGGPAPICPLERERAFILPAVSSVTVALAGSRITRDQARRKALWALPGSLRSKWQAEQVGIVI